MDQLPAQLLPALTHFKFLIFDISLPNLIIGVVSVVFLVLGAWLRLPRFIEHGRESDKGDAR